MPHSATLFDDVTTWPPPFGEYCHIQKRTKSADLYSYAGHVMLGQPSTWHWHGLKAVDPDVTLITGAVPIGVTRKGGPKWPPASEDRQLAVKPADLDMLRTKWEAEHRRCAECGGDGVEYMGSSSTHGFKYCECRRCNGSGAPREAVVNAA